MRPKPELLARYELRPAAGETFPPDWERVFGRRAPLAVELGFGNGEFLAAAAAAAPEWDFVGIERPQQCLVRGVANLHAAGRANVRLVQGDGRYLLRELFPRQSLRLVLLQFPMPWPRARQAKHRVIGERLAATLADVLELGGGFELVTDQDWYAAAAAADLERAGCFAVSAPAPPPERPLRTRYEHRWLAQGRSLWRVYAQLLRAIPAPRLCQEDVVYVQRFPSVPASAAVSALAGRRFAAPGCVAEIQEVWSGGEGWLLRAVAADDSFSQLFYLRLARLPDTTALLRLEDGTRPYPTRAVRFLFGAVAGALAPASACG